MKIAVFGAGAIGGYVAAKLAEAGRVSLSLVARGAQLEAIRASGIALIEGGVRSVHPVRAEADAAVLGHQDYVLLTLKAHSIPTSLEQIAPLLGPDTAVVTMQNGVPWWYFHRIGGAYEGRQIEAVDPGGHIWRRIGPERAIGAVVYPAAEVEAPGVVRHVEGNRLTLGEPDGSRSKRVVAIADELIAAGLQSPVRADIRTEIWVKLLGNVAFNPVSALTGSLLSDLLADPETLALVETMMREAVAIGEALGIRFPIDLDQRINGARQVGAHKTSMLQDLELGRPMEIDALVTAVQELGRLVGVPSPSIDTVHALVRRLATQRGCYP